MANTVINAPTLKDYFKSMVESAYKADLTSSLERAFYAASAQFEAKHGFLLPFSFSAFKEQYYPRRK